MDRRPVALPWLLLAAFPLAGCISTQLPEPQTALPERFESAIAPPVEQVSLERWWLLFGDAQLTSLVDEALERAPDARSALAVLHEARATRRQAMAPYDVQGNLSGSAARQRNEAVEGNAADTTLTSLSGTFSPSWEVDLFGRRAAARGAADADLAASTFVYHAARQSLSASVAAGLFDARGLAVQLANARETLRIAQALARLGERRASAGLGTGADAASLAADEASARASVTAFEAQLAVSRRNLLVLIGRGTEPLEAVPIDAALGNAPPVPTTAPATLLARRPDIREAEARLRAAIGTLRLDERALLPTFNLLPSANLSRTSGSGTAVATGLWSIGMGLTLPIFDRARLMAQVRAQQARSLQAVIAYEKAVQTGYGEAENRLAVYAADRTRLTALAQADAHAQQAFEAQRAGYRAGIVDLATLLQAERTWRTSRNALATLRATTLSDAVDCFRALGGGWPAASPFPPGTDQ